MTKTNWQDPRSTEIRSTQISGLQEAVGKIEESIGINTLTETNISLPEVYISNEDRFRIYQALEGKRNWLSSPPPIIKKNGVVITNDFEIDFGGGAVIFTTPISETDVLTADISYTAKIIGKQLSSEDYSSAEKEKLSGIETGANKYIHPENHPASMISLNDASNVEDNIVDIKESISSHESGTATNAHKASNISITDSEECFTATNVESALNELFTSANNGKTAVAAAITAKGVDASLADTFPVLANKIGQITTSKGTAIPSVVRKGYTFSNDTDIDIPGTLDIPDEAWFKPHATWYRCGSTETTTYSDDIGSCVCDNKLYFIAKMGGGSEETKVNKTLMYDPYTDIWVEETPPPTGIVYHSYFAGVYNHKLYWHTNYPPTSATDNIYIYDTIAKTWSSITVKTTLNHGARARWVMTDENTFYCIGGDGVYRVDLYNRLTDTVTQKADAPGYMANAGVLYHKETNTIYVCGNSYSVSSTIMCAYNCTTNTWYTKTPLFSSIPVYRFSIITKDENNILIGGGYKDSGTSFNTIYNYDILTNTYSTHLTTPTSKMSGSIALINNKLYWYGGYTMGGLHNTSVYFY